MILGLTAMEYVFPDSVFIVMLSRDVGVQPTVLVVSVVRTDVATKIDPGSVARVVALLPRKGMVPAKHVSLLARGQARSAALEKDAFVKGSVAGLCRFIELPRAGGTYPIEFVFVRAHREAVACCDFFLDPLNGGLFEFCDVAALNADQMIVMLIFIRDLVACHTIVEATFVCDPAFSQKLEGAVHRCVPDAVIDCSNLCEEIFNGDMSRGLEKLLDN